MIEDRIRKWLIKASEDLRTIEHEFRLSEEEIITSTVCFHAQQAAEKLLKSFLVSRNVEFGKTHNLYFLLNLCAKEDEDFKNLDVGPLSFYGVEVRYPDEFYVPSIDEAHACSKIATAVNEFVLKKFGIDKEGTL